MIVVVSGGSRGLGAAISGHLLAAGHRVAAFARSETALVEQLRSQWPDSYLFGLLDGTDYEAAKDFIAKVAERWNRIDALVNNAAVGQDSLLAHTEPDRIREIIRINLEGPILLTRLVVREMLRGDRPGRIVNISSVGASQGHAGLAVYAATKGAVESFTRALAVELGGRIRVNAVAPGFFDSEMSGVLLPEQRAAIVRRTRTGELTTAEGLCEVISLLLDGRSNVNGAVIPVDGGASA